ncbi:putative n-acetyltransferase b complex non catalytic subunit [Rosellinia necatrix]|uniref:Putative n-acetyltransferase b complex non catalytic subunit n=1 Tax=Rosellinia necatrix TaxID=77044 RepID=A0A1W2TU16_ROSNE|nr:putative n-acetyltransferase b complex non catalytic subunit [Rosellinia necatrix]
MMPLRIPPIARPVQLKHTVDIQLDHAFHEQQWGIAANLARQRYKATKDDYYKAVEVAARSRGDNATDRTSGRDAVQAMVNDNTVVKDIDALDLYEFAMDGLPIDYAKTIGVLRARLAKSLPKDQNAGLRCFEACMWNSDWENAQEISVSLNKNFPGDRRLLFQNIVTTFLVATADNTHENKKKLFPNLAKAQVDRAFNLRPPTGKEQTPPSRINFGENEIKLWIKIRERFGTAQENLKLLSFPNWGPLVFLERGFMDAFLQSMQLLTFNGQWEEINRIVNIIFDKVIAMKQGNPATTNDPGEQVERPTTSSPPNDTANADLLTASRHIVEEQHVDAAREWSVWMHALNAIKNMPNRQDALDLFRNKVEQVVSVLTSNHRMNPVFQQNYERILLEITFNEPTTTVKSSVGETKGNKKVQNLLELTKKNLKNSYCFTTLKGYLDQLTTAEIADFVSAWETECPDDTPGLDMFDKLLVITLRLRVRFFQATSLRVGEECRFCHVVSHDATGCRVCLESISERALDSFSVGVQDQDVSRKAVGAIEDPLSNLTILGSMCLIKLAGADHENWQSMKESPFCHIDLRLFLQGVAWLDFYLRKAPKNDSLRLLLVKLYLRMGCVTRALQIWSLFDVKNTLLECLGTICLDRLASISPSHFMTGPSQRSFADPFTRHFETAIQKRYPDTVIKTLQNSSYAELPGIIELAQNQSRNCVSVLAVIEARRGIRLKSNRTETSIEDESLIGCLSPEYELKDFTDYNPLPHWAGPASTPIQKLVAYGPLPTNRRSHLSVLAERFLDLVCHVQPKEFKPTKAAQLLQVDWQAAGLSCKILHQDLDTMVYGQGHGHDENDMTDPEAWYFRTVTELAKLAKLVLEQVLPAPPSKAAREEVLAAVRRIATIMTYQLENFLSAPDGIQSKMHTFHTVTALHSMGMLRESTLAVRHTVQYLAASLDRLKATADRSRGATEAAWLAPETKKLVAAAAAADTQMKRRVGALAQGLHASGWVDCLGVWTFGDNDNNGNDDDEVSSSSPSPGSEFKRSIAATLARVILPDAREVWALDVADSWRDVVKGWGAVRFD